MLQNPLRIVECLAAALRERAQAVPLRTDALAAGVHAGHLVVLQGAGDCQDKLVETFDSRFERQLARYRGSFAGVEFDLDW